MEEFDILSGVLLSVFAVVLIICLIACIFSIIYSCFLYKKMGVSAWVAIIPFYNSWVWSEKVLGHGAWMFTAFLPMIGCLWYPMCCWQTFQGFGKDTWFCVLGIFFPGIFLPICAFDKSTFTPQKLDF